MTQPTDAEIAERDELIEAARWHMTQYTIDTPKAFREALQQSWVRKDTTRNHGKWSGGIQREERRTGTIEVDDVNFPLLGKVITGRIITAIDRDEDPSEEWAHGQNAVTITLDDGSRVRFVGWGYDASGLATSYEPPPVNPRSSITDAK